METLVIIKDYVTKIDKLYQTNRATELTYKPDFIKLLRALLPDCGVYKGETPRLWWSRHHYSKE